MAENTNPFQPVGTSTKEKLTNAERLLKDRIGNLRILTGMRAEAPITEELLRACAEVGEAYRYRVHFAEMVRKAEEERKAREAEAEKQKANIALMAKIVDSIGTDDPEKVLAMVREIQAARAKEGRK